MRKLKVLALTAVVAASTVMTSCIGSFALTNKMLDWNQNISDKWVNEVVFFAMHIVPVYEISILADAVVLNSIEFWTDSNPIAAGTTKKVIGSDGKEYVITATKTGYQIEQGKQNVELRYDAKTRTWSAIAAGKTSKLVTVKEDGTADIHTPQGIVNVTRDAQGMTALR